MKLCTGRVWATFAPPKDVLSTAFVDLILATLERFKSELLAGALVVIDERRSRVRVLPIG